MYENQMEAGLRLREHGRRTSFSVQALGRLYKGRELEVALRLLYIREGVAEVESGGLCVGKQPEHLQARAEGAPLLSVRVPDGALMGFNSLRTFLFIA